MSDSVTVPMNQQEAREYEAPSRRYLWNGLLIMAAIVFFLILITMEVRERMGIADPVPNPQLDQVVAEALGHMAPLPEGLRGVTVETSAGGWGYRVALTDRAGDLLHGVEIAAASAGLVDAGSRAGTPINFHVEVSLDRAGDVSGRYRVDRGVHLQRYEGVLTVILQQALVAYQTALVLGESIPSNPDWTADEIRDSWN